MLELEACVHDEDQNYEKAEDAADERRDKGASTDIEAGYRLLKKIEEV